MSMGEPLDMSACQELDVMGMYPHSRQYLEYEVNRMRSTHKGSMLGVLGMERRYDAQNHREGVGAWDADFFPEEHVGYSEKP